MELINLIDRIESLRRELTAYQPLMPEWQEKLNKKFRLEFNYNSNHIEGNTLTYGETELYLIFDKTTGNHDGREYEEMKASDVALKLIREYAADKERPLTETFIKNLNEVILVRPYWVNAITPDGQPTRREISIGDYKKHPNSVRLQNGEMFHYASPQETPALMSDLVQWYKAELEKEELHPVALAALLHYRFVCIHPFDDGNGRISRLLMNYVLYNNGLPPVVIKSADKKNYLFALNKADSGDFNAFLEYVATQMLWSLEVSIKAAKGEEIEEMGDVEKEIAVFKKNIKKSSSINLIERNELARLIYYQSIGPFIKLFEEKLSASFRELFEYWYFTGYMNNLVNPIIITGLQSNDFNLSFINIFSIKFEVFMKWYKHNVANHFNLFIGLEIILNDSGYIINITGDPNFSFQNLKGEKNYRQLISLEEQQKIISDTQKSIFEFIKHKTEAIS